jgi:hypothetical protein
MPAVRGQSPLMAKLGPKAKAAFDAHKGDAVEMSDFSELPPGIEGGVAQLVKCAFQEIKTGDNAGKIGWFAQGVVVEPKEATTYVLDEKGNQRPSGVMRVDGLRTRISENVFETPGKARETLEEHVAHVQNEMKKLLPDADPEMFALENIEATAALLEQGQPYFRFRTYAGKPTPQYPNPRTFHSWSGATEYAPGEPAAAADDATAQAPAVPVPSASAATPRNRLAARPTANGPAPRAAAPAPGVRPAARAPVRPTPPPPAEDEAPPPADDDLEALAAEADDPADEERQAAAQDRLLTMAAEAGIPDDEAQATDSWAQLAGMIAEAGSPAATGEAAGSDEGEPAEEEPAAEPYVPQKGDVVLYKPVDPKTRRKAAKAVECEVLAAAARGQTVTLKNLDNPKIQYKAVSWADLEPG